MSKPTLYPYGMDIFLYGTYVHARWQIPAPPWLIRYGYFSLRYVCTRTVTNTGPTLARCSHSRRHRPLAATIPTSPWSRPPYSHLIAAGIRVCLLVLGGSGGFSASEGCGWHGSIPPPGPHRGPRYTAVDVAGGHPSSRLRLHSRAAVEIADGGLIGLDNLQLAGFPPDPAVSMSGCRDLKSRSSRVLRSWFGASMVRSGRYLLPLTLACSFIHYSMVV
jgi:hypothetical protein